MRLAFAITLALSGLTMTGTAQARETGSAAIDCYCTDRSGSLVELGQTICLIVDGRAYLARCEMSQNVPAWRDIGEDCVGAALKGPGWPAVSVGSSGLGGA